MSGPSHRTLSPQSEVCAPSRLCSLTKTALSSERSLRVADGHRVAFIIVVPGAKQSIQLILRADTIAEALSKTGMLIHTKSSVNGNVDLRLDVILVPDRVLVCRTSHVM